MGTSGLVGQFSAYGTMVAEGRDPVIVLLIILLMHFILPGAVTLGIAEGMRRAKWIKDGDMKIKL
jgi:uncharacterized membrane protein